MTNEFESILKVGKVLISFMVVGAIFMTAYRYKREGLIMHIGNLASGLIGFLGAVIIAPIICLVFIKGTPLCRIIAETIQSLALPVNDTSILGEDVVSPILTSITEKTVYYFIKGIIFLICMFLCTAVGKLIVSVCHITRRITAKFSLTDMLNKWGGFFYGLLIQYIGYSAIFFAIKLFSWMQPIQFIANGLNAIPACTFFFKFNIFYLLLL